MGKSAIRRLLAVALALVLAAAFSLTTIQQVVAYYGSSCDEYGVMAYESGGHCKCMSGYVMGEGILGDTQCVSGDSVCTDKYGYGARYDSLGGSCECRSGYVWGEDLFGNAECVTENQACIDQLGYNARATFGGQCECNYGYVIDGGQCNDGDQVCRLDHGLYASYDNLSNECQCDDGYTFDDDYQCVKKQNNVYFKVLDTDIDNKELLIKSEYDFQRYIVRYGLGCLASSIERYKGKNIVVNLGTDYDVDSFDTIVLQDHNQTCSIMSRERTYEDAFAEEEDYPMYFDSDSTTSYEDDTSSDGFDWNFFSRVESEITEETSVDSEPITLEDDEVSSTTLNGVENISDLNAVSTSVEEVMPTENTSLISKLMDFIKKFLPFWSK